MLLHTYFFGANRTGSHELIIPLPHFRLLGDYMYPMKNPPSLLHSKKRKAKQRIEVLKHSICTHNYLHKCLTVMCSVIANTFEKRIGDSRCCFPDTAAYRKIFIDKKMDNLIFIMMPSHNRATTAKLNWTHMMIDSDGHMHQYIQVVFVRQEDYGDYKKIWNGKLGIVTLPDKMTGIKETVQNGGIGYARRFIQMFCHHYGIHLFYMADDNIVYFKKGIKNETVISFMELHNKLSLIGSESYIVPKKYDGFERHEGFPRASHCNAAYSGPLREFGIIGIRKKRISHGNYKSWFTKRHCQSLLLINNKILLERNVLFKPWPAWEDLYFCNEAEEKGLHVLKLNVFSVTKCVGSKFTDMYLWRMEDKIDPANHRKANIDTIDRVLERFLKSLRIAKIEGVNLKNLSNITKVDHGTTVFGVDDLQSFTLHDDDQDVTLIVPMEVAIRFKMHSIQTIENLIKDLKETNEQPSIEVSSTHAINPVMMNDFVAIRIVYPKRLLRKPVLGKNQPITKVK